MNLTRLDKYIAEGRLIRGSWTGVDALGRETACLLAALVPEGEKEQSASACLASAMPVWWVGLTVWIDDNGTEQHWREVTLVRYPVLARRWHVLDAAGWDRVSVRVRVGIIREALSHVTVDEWGVRAACEGMIAALETGQAPDAGTAASAASAAGTAASAVYAVYAASAAASAVASAVYAASAAADRIIDVTLDALEAEIVRAEAT